MEIYTKYICLMVPLNSFPKFSTILPFADLRTNFRILLTILQ